MVLAIRSFHCEIEKAKVEREFFSSLAPLEEEALS
jgi:hypothetical protein